MTVAPNPVDGAVIGEAGHLRPMGKADASTPDTERLDTARPVPVAMTGGRQITAAWSQ